MTRSTLFGYTVEKEEDDDSVVITVSGPMARTFLQRLAGDPRNRHGTGLLPAPLPWRALGSRSVEINAGRERQPNGADDKPDLKDIFGQGFDRSYSEFDAQLATYRSLLDQEEPRPADPPSPNGARRGARRKARRQGTSKRATGRGD
jgi:hypothetical protein